eukprot:TRINITY_DN9580_c0_g1_i2.p1 TRINITY_DN9580_c0_g1~~TRINITY_DN9580_c0_g1_i2.p1  ORF type:complete len:105 (-),score=1.36 TRINITY_DN9580_c0_g1_i2:32-346(-)
MRHKKILKCMNVLVCSSHEWAVQVNHSNIISQGVVHRQIMVGKCRAKIRGNKIHFEGENNFQFETLHFPTAVCINNKQLQQETLHRSYFPGYSYCDMMGSGILP